MKHDKTRSAEQIKEHYEIEYELASKLRKSTRSDRIDNNLYTVLYDELFARVPHHPQLTRKVSPEISQLKVGWQLSFIKKFVDKDSAFVELGPGDCKVTIAACEFVRKGFAIDVSKLITQNANTPENFELIIYNGYEIPLPQGSVDVIYSNQLMEHIHPSDAYDQLKSIYQVLKKEGKYLCITPNRINGPWDISRYFDPYATGFHLKEYSASELKSLFLKVGFRKVHTYIGARGKYIRAPYLLVRMIEMMISPLPNKLRQRIGKSAIVRMILGLRMVAIK